MNHGGAGKNKRCGQIEATKRIDSFEIRNSLFLIGGFKTLPFEFEEDHVFVDDGFSGGDCIKVTYMENRSGRHPFFICPKCGRRVRFLYIPCFLCRDCSHLNYRSQQITKSSYNALVAIPEKLDVERPGKSWQEDYALPRPRYMHKKRFERYQERFKKYQERYVEREVREYLKLYRFAMKCLKSSSDLDFSLKPVRLHETGFDACSIEDD